MIIVDTVKVSAIERKNKDSQDSFGVMEKPSLN